MKPIGLTDLADLHRHLDGSLRQATLTELARAQNLPDPGAPRFVAGMGLRAALDCFAKTLAVLQTAAVVRRVASEVCEDAAREGVTTLEIRFAPQLHLQRGATVAAIVDAALAGIGGRAGLILCGLYGEEPSVLEGHVDLARTRLGVVGVDLAGGPQVGERWTLLDYAPAFGEARKLGLGRTVHAGEGRPPDEIRMAIEHLHAQRIGHGTSLADDPRIMAQVAEAGVVVEVCVTSNVHTALLTSPSKHPLPRWLAAGVKACICTDNTLLSATDAPTEHERIAMAPGMTAAGLAGCVATGHEAAFRRDPGKGESM